MRYALDTDVMIPMRDGTRLATNIWRSSGDDPVPVLFARTPYGKDDMHAGGLYLGTSPNIFAVLDAGYAVAVQDTRGTGRSEGAFRPLRDEAADGADAIRWLAGQRWCNGSVGMWGPSYLGFTQWCAAVSGEPGLKAIAPSLSGADAYRSLSYSPGGALSLQAHVMWSLFMAMQQAMRKLSSGEAELADVGSLAAMLGDEPGLLATTPVGDHPLIAKHIDFFSEALAHPGRDEYWTSVSAIELPDTVVAPALTIAGWYDIFLGESLAAHVAVRERGGSAQARNGQQLIIGPWSHSATVGMYGVFPDRDFGPAGSFMAAQLTTAHLAFFDRWLKGREEATAGGAPVRIFVMGIDQWRDEQAWPLSDAIYDDYHLGGSGNANTADGDGALSVEPAPDDATETFTYDPGRPVPTVGGQTFTFGFNGPADQSGPERRPDVLCFTGPVLKEPVEVTGPVRLTLFVSSSAVDTDFAAKLVDVFSDGRAILLCEGFQRLRYRDSITEPTLAEPGKVYEITVDMSATSNVFQPGHRIRLDVTSSNFPRFDRNGNTGGAVSEERLEDMAVAVNHVHHGPSFPSRITLPVIRRAAGWPMPTA